MKDNPNCHYGERYLKDAEYNERCYSLCANLIHGLEQGELTPTDLINQYNSGTDTIWDEVYKQI